MRRTHVSLLEGFEFPLNCSTPEFSTRALEAAGSLEDATVSEQPPQQEENQHGAEAPAAELLRSVASGESAKKLAHEFLGVRLSRVR